MSKYLLQGEYTVEGTKGLLKGGATARQEAISELLRSVDGSLDQLFFPVAGPGYVVLMNMPDKRAVTAVMATIVASGAVTVTSCIEVLSPKEMDETAKLTPIYRAPGR